jgi:PAS domain S-box-containing protein
MENTHFENFFNLSTELLCMIDQKGFFTLINPVFSSTLGYTPEELYHRPYTSFIHPEDLELTHQQALKLLRGERVQQFENRYITKDQKIVWLSWASTTLYNGYYYAAAKDVTTLKEAEQSLQTSENKFRSLVQNGYEIISIVGPDGTYQYHSDSIYRLLGFRPLELIGLSAKDLIHPDDLAKVNRGMAQLQDKTYVNNGIPYRIKTVDGSYKWIESTGANMVDDPSIRGIVVNTRDVTEKVMLEQELKNQAQLKEKEVTVSMIKGQEKERIWLGQELHDNINQLLTSAKLYLEFIENDDTNRDRLLGKSIQIIQTVIGEIRKLSHQLVLPDYRTFDLQQSIEQVVNNLLSTSDIKIEFEFTFFDHSSLLEEFKIVLYRIVQEQLTNIIKHSEATQVRLCLKKEPSNLQLTVEDNGKGFDPALKKQGIGFSNISERARVFGGEVLIDTAPNKGCKLQVIFPSKDIEILETHQSKSK